VMSDENDCRSTVLSFSDEHDLRLPAEDEVDQRTDVSVVVDHQDSCSHHAMPPL